MEPPPGPCSSPPGPRPVPPPRRGSEDRRPLSPVRRGASDGKPGTPERSTVTQRVLIVMQSRESTSVPSWEEAPSHSASVPNRGEAPSNSASVTGWGEAPSLSASVPIWRTPLPVDTPVPSWREASSHSASVPIWRAPPFEDIPVPRRWEAPSHSTTVPSRGETPSHSASVPIWRAPPLSDTPVPSCGEAPSHSASVLSQGAPPPEDTPVPRHWEALSHSASVPGQGEVLSHSASIPSRGVPPSEDTPVTSQGEAPSPSTSVSSRREAPSHSASVLTRGESPSKSTSVPSRKGPPPEYTLLQRKGEPPLQSTSVPSRGEPPYEYSSVLSWEAPPSQSTTIASMGVSTAENSLIQNQEALPADAPLLSQGVSPPYTVAAERDTSPHSHSILLQKAMVHTSRLSPQESVTHNHRVSPQESVTQYRGTSLEDTATHRQGVTLQDSTTHTHLLPKQDSVIQSLATAEPQQSTSTQNALLSTHSSASVFVTDSSLSDGVKQSQNSIPLERVTENDTSLPSEGLMQNAISLSPVGVTQSVTNLPREGIAQRGITLPPEGIAQSITTPPPEGIAQSATTRQTEGAMKSSIVLPPEIVMQSITGLQPGVLTQQTQDAGMSSVDNVTQRELNSISQTSNPSTQPSLGGSSLSPIRAHESLSPHRNISSKPPLPIPPRSILYPGHPPPREQEASLSHETASLSSYRSKAPAPDTLSYLDSVSLMSGTLESLTMLDDASSLGSDSEINGIPYRKTDKYGFLGGNQFSGNGESTVSLEIARQRELKWLDMFSHWDKWLIRRFQKVKLRCRKGIPSSLRARAWQYLCNSDELLRNNMGKFEEMERQPGDPKWLDVIEKDLHRQFPFHEMFAARGGHGQQDLYRILKAYTVYRPEEGYCQAQAPVAAVLLMHMPAEQAFWCLVQICDKYLPGYYSAGLEAIQLDGEIFFALLRRACPMAYRHLKKFKIDPILYMTEWFMCIFSRTLPWASVLRVWDMFFCEGVKIIFRVGLVLLRHTLGSVDKLRSCQGMYETMEKLRSLPVHCMQEEVLLPEVSSLPVTDAVIERESNTQLRKWRENRGELQYRPSRRMHGARQIYEEKLRLNPTLSGSRLSLSSIRRPSPPPMPAVTQPESVVVSEGLHPALPSPTSNNAPLGPPKEAAKKGKEKQKEKEKKREKEEREREKKREKEEREEREREQRREREREKQKEKEEKRVQKEKQKRERKFSFRRKDVSSPAADPPQKADAGAAAHHTYF